MGFRSSALLGLVSLIIDSLWASGHLHCWVWCLSSWTLYGLQVICIVGSGVSHHETLYGLQVICIVGSGVSHHRLSMGFRSSALLGLVSLIIDSLWASGHLHCWVWCLSSQTLYGLQVICIVGSGVSRHRLSMGFRSSALLGLVSLVIDSLWASGHLHCWVWCLSSLTLYGLQVICIVGSGVSRHRLSMGFRSSALLGLVSLIIDSLWASGHLHCWVWCLSS